MSALPFAYAWRWRGGLTWKLTLTKNPNAHEGIEIKELFDHSDRAGLVIEQQAEIERLRAFITDFAGNRFERIERRAQDPQDDHDPVTDWNAIDAWQDDARAVLEVKP